MWGAMQVALAVMVLAAVAVTLGIGTLRFGIRLGDAAYSAAGRYGRRRLAMLRVWLMCRRLRGDLHTGYFKPWEDEEELRRRHERG